MYRPLNTLRPGYMYIMQVDMSTTSTFLQNFKIADRYIMRSACSLFICPHIRKENLKRPKDTFALKIRYRTNSIIQS